MIWLTMSVSSDEWVVEVSDMEFNALYDNMTGKIIIAYKWKFSTGRIERRALYLIFEHTLQNMSTKPKV